MASDGENEIVQEFLIESYENLDNLDRELVTLESHPEDAKALGSIFRMINTMAQFLEPFADDVLPAIIDRTSTEPRVTN